MLARLWRTALVSGSFGGIVAERSRFTLCESDALAGRLGDRESGSALSGRMGGRAL